MKGAAGLAVVVGGYLNGLTVVRALGAFGVRSVVVTTKPFDVAHRSRFCVERVHLPALHGDPTLWSVCSRSGAGAGAALRSFPPTTSRSRRSRAATSVSPPGMSRSRTRGR